VSLNKNDIASRDRRPAICTTILQGSIAANGVTKWTI